MKNSTFLKIFRDAKYCSISLLGKNCSISKVSAIFISSLSCMYWQPSCTFYPFQKIEILEPYFKKSPVPESIRVLVINLSDKNLGRCTSWPLNRWSLQSRRCCSYNWSGLLIFRYWIQKFLNYQRRGYESKMPELNFEWNTICNSN